MVHTERRKRAISGKGRRTYQERLKNMADIGLWRQTIVCIAGLGAGILVSAGVFTVLLLSGKGRRTYQERLKNMADIGLWRQTIVCIAGLGAGILVSAGVFTVLLSVGLVPRFAGKTHTGEKIFLYEDRRKNIFI